MLRLDEPRLKLEFLEHLLRLRESIAPYSLVSAVVALVCLASAVCLRAALALLDTELGVAAYFPATLAAGLLAGIPAAIVVALASFIVEWWLFTSPRLGFAPIDRSAVIALASWIATIGLLILFTHWARSILDSLSARVRELNLITRELEHRGRNTHAVLEGIIRQTLQDDPERADSLLGRIRSFQQANDLIANAPAACTQLRTLLRLERGAYDMNRVDLRGPDIELPPDTTRSLVLILHELATNAAKYGALAAPAGRIGIVWEATRDQLMLTWVERDGPSVKHPQRQGFGSRLIHHCATSLGGTYESEFAPDGLRAVLTFPLRRGETQRIAGY